MKIGKGFPSSDVTSTLNQEESHLQPMKLGRENINIWSFSWVRVLCDTRTTSTSIMSSITYCEIEDRWSLEPKGFLTMSSENHICFCYTLQSISYPTDNIFSQNISFLTCLTVPHKHIVHIIIIYWFCWEWKSFHFWSLFEYPCSIPYDIMVISTHES